MRSSALRRAARTMLVLNAPARPRSPVATMIRWVSSLPVPASSFGVCGPGVMREARLATTSVMRVEYGRAAVAFCWARRSFDAATMFSALVIFCVDLTEPMRSLRALSDAILGECLPEAGKRVLQRGGGVVVERLGVADLGEDLRLLRAEEAQHRRLVADHVLDIDAVEEALRAGVD